MTTSTCSLCKADTNLGLALRVMRRVYRRDVCAKCLKTMFASVGYSFEINPQGELVLLPTRQPSTGKDITPLTDLPDCWRNRYCPHHAQYTARCVADECADELEDALGPYVQYVLNLEEKLTSAREGSKKERSGRKESKYKYELVNAELVKVLRYIHDQLGGLAGKAGRGEEWEHLDITTIEHLYRTIKITLGWAEIK